MDPKSIVNNLIHFASLPEDISPVDSDIVVNTYTAVIAAVEKLSGVAIICMALDDDPLKYEGKATVLAEKIRDKMQSILDNLIYEENLYTAILSVSIDPPIPDMSSCNLMVTLSKKGVAVSVLDGVVEDVLLACLINLSLAGHFYTARLSPCEKCGNIFYKNDTKRKYCSLNCSNATQQAKFRTRANSNNSITIKE